MPGPPPVADVFPIAHRLPAVMAAVLSSSSTLPGPKPSISWPGRYFCFTVDSGTTQKTVSVAEARSTMISNVPVADCVETILSGLPTPIVRAAVVPLAALPGSIRTANVDGCGPLIGWPRPGVGANCVRFWTSDMVVIPF